MTSSQQSPQSLPVAGQVASDLTDDRAREGMQDATGPAVGASDAEADVARSGGDADLDDATRDSDGVLVGEADREEDERASGA